jgi:hypothetical protein
MVIRSAKPGKKLIQYFPLRIYSYPLEINSPNEGSVIGKPTPRNERVASNVIANATLTVATTISGGRQFGSK